MRGPDEITLDQSRRLANYPHKQCGGSCGKSRWKAIMLVRPSTLTMRLEQDNDVIHESVANSFSG